MEASLVSRKSGNNNNNTSNSFPSNPNIFELTHTYLTYNVPIILIDILSSPSLPTLAFIIHLLFDVLDWTPSPLLALEYEKGRRFEKPAKESSESIWS